jgi:hypothetical protein
LWSSIRRFFGGASAPEPGAAPGSASAPSPAGEARPDRRALFTAEVERALAATGANVVRHLPDEFAIVAKRGDAEFTVYLNNTFVETRDVDPDERARRIRILVGMFPGTGTKLDWEEAAPRLVPILRPATMFLAVLAQPNAKPVVHRTAAPMLLEAVAIDFPQSMQMLTEDQVAEWGVPRETVFERARANLGAAGAVIRTYDPEASYPIFVVANDDSYESSRILLPGFLTSFADKVKGRPIAIAPERALLVVGGDGDAACVRRLVDAAERQWSSSPRSITPALYAADDQGNLVPYHAPPGHPLAGAIELGHLKLAMQEYEQQKPILQGQLGDDVFVATFSAVKTSDDEFFSYCTWTRDVPSILPRTDFVMLFDPEGGGEPRRVAWAELIASGRLQPVPDVEPPRFRTGIWPESE